MGIMVDEYFIILGHRGRTRVRGKHAKSTHLAHTPDAKAY